MRIAATVADTLPQSRGDLVDDPAGTGAGTGAAAALDAERLRAAGRG